MENVSLYKFTHIALLKNNGQLKKNDKQLKKDTVGPEGPRGFGPFHFKPKAHTEEEEVPGDEMKGIQIARTYYRGRPCPR